MDKTTFLNMRCQKNWSAFSFTVCAGRGQSKGGNHEEGSTIDLSSLCCVTTIFTLLNIYLQTLMKP